MKFLVDAQLPIRLAYVLSDLGHDAKHTLQLPEANRTQDVSVTQTADAEGRIVVSKDNDFPEAHQARGAPKRVLHISIGNCVNSVLLAAVRNNFEEIVQAFNDADYVELGFDANGNLRVKQHAARLFDIRGIAKRINDDPVMRGVLDRLAES